MWGSVCGRGLTDLFGAHLVSMLDSRLGRDNLPGDLPTVVVLPILLGASALHLDLPSASESSILHIVLPCSTRQVH